MPAATKKVLVVGATGATGKHVVQCLLDKGHNVVAVARSQEKMMSLLTQKDYSKNLTVEELSISDLSPSQSQELTKGCDAVVRYVDLLMVICSIVQLLYADLLFSQKPHLEFSMIAVASATT